MGRIVMSSQEAKNRLLEGVNSLVDIVKVTMGPAGRNVLLNNGMSQRITKDGVSVAKEIKFDNPTKEAGARLVKEAAQKTCDDSGDATTLTSVLIQAIVVYGSELLSETNIRPIELKRQLDAACKYIVNQLNELAIPCDNDEMLHQVALISSNGDKEIADLVVQAMKQATKDGAVGIETSESNESYVETVMGMRFERGWESEFFQNDENSKACIFESPNVLIYRGKLDNINEFAKMLEPAINIGMPLLIMADEFSQDITNALAMNKVQNGFRLCAVRLPAFKEQRNAIVSDLEVLLGCKAVNTRECSVDDFNVETNLGSCDKVVVDRHFTTITGGDGDKDELTERIDGLRFMVERCGDKDVTARLRERLVKLSGGVSIIYVGSDSETETEEIKDRADDSVCAVRGAMLEGIVPGGGVTLMKIIDDCKNPAGFEDIYDMMKRVCYAPVIQLIVNACEDDVYAGYVASQISDNNKYKSISEVVGIDLKKPIYDENPKFDCLIECGIIDPKKSIRSALENAISVGGMLLTTEACVVEDIR